MNSLALARQERKKQGPLEVEFSYGGEADLYRHFIDCEKNPGHHKFVSVDQFSVKNLPEGYEDKDLVELVQATSSLTVRVAVMHVSEKRPMNIPGTDHTYPCYRNRGTDMMRVGTGWVEAVIKFPNENDSDSKRYQTCECRECLNSPTPRTLFAHIHILTAAHVVYDNLEGAFTTCHLYFDRGGTPDLCSGVVTLSGMSHVWSNIDRDLCQMIYVTHDLSLADKLDMMVQQWNSLTQKVEEKYLDLDTQKSATETDSIPDTQNTLMIIVSHPHGCSKQVSVGHFTDRYEKEGILTRYMYTTATCPGSSGAFVLVMGREWWKQYYSHVHSGSCGGDKELNESCF